MRQVYCVDERGVIAEPYQAPDTMAKKKGFVIKVQEMYKWKNVPVVKVLFYDCQRFADKLRDDATAAQTMKSFFSVTWLNAVKRIVADQQVSNDKLLLLSILYLDGYYPFDSFFDG